jgi:uncharacterized hydrophobic protein (TIGR00271 family)
LTHLGIELGDSSRERLYQSILESNHLNVEYAAMLAFAGLIALFGLLQNSVAVIIGAMLISPLMNPILAAALALILGDWSLGRRALSVLAWSIGGVIALSCLVAWLTPLKQVTPEILARTNPNLLDLLVAVLAGLAGTLALRGGPVSMTIIPGVAIAVAVVPPLAVVGFSLSTYHGVMAWGGFLLFVTNLVSIMISAAVVFLLMGFTPHEGTEESKAKLYRRMAISALVLIVLAIPLVQTLRRAVTQIGLRADVQDVIQGAFKTDHSTISDLSFTQAGKNFQVSVAVRTTQYFESEQIEAAQQSLRKRFGANTQLMVDQILVAQGGLSAAQVARLRDFISGTVVQPPPKEVPFDLRGTSQKITTYLQKQVDEVLGGTSIRSAGPLRADLGSPGPLVLTLQLTGLEPLEAQTVKLLASQLSTKVSQPTALHGVMALEGPSYKLALVLPGAKARLAAADRKILSQMADILRTHTDLQLQVSVSADDMDDEAIKASRAWRDLDEILKRSRLDSAHWSMRATATTTAPAPLEAIGPKSGPTEVKTATPPATKSPGPLHCDLAVSQTF